MSGGCASFYRCPCPPSRGRPATARLLLGAALVACTLSGCGWLGDDSDNPQDEPLVSFEPAENSAPAHPGGQTGPKLQLNLGERFPLVKTVEQTLAQRASSGSTTSHSQLELYLELSVQEAPDDGRRRIGVEYHRVRYVQNLGGETIEYDSNLPHGPIPAGVLAYQGLAHNGFSFWIGPDNRVIELVGFDEFLKRCVSDISLERRERVLYRLSTSTVEETVASFLDDSIGLLTYGGRNEPDNSVPQVGATWTRARSIDRPVPIHLSQRYTLKELNERMAAIDVAGTIAPQDVYQTPGANVPGIDVSVRGGHVFGNCSIDLRTGLPLNSRVERRVEMKVSLAGGQEFDQIKRTVTSIRALPMDAAARQSPQTSQTFAGVPSAADGAGRHEQAAHAPTGPIPR